MSIDTQNERCLNTLALFYEYTPGESVLAVARAAFEVAVEEKPGARFIIRQRIRVVKRHREGDW